MRLQSTRRATLWGSISDTNFVPHGFLLRKGTFTTIDPPSSTFTALLGINPEGDIVGFYAGSSVGSGGGFLLRKGRFTNIDVPGALAGSTSANGINPQSDIVGSYSDSSGLHGFLLSKGRFTTINVPAAFGIGAQAYGINPEGDIVGLYSDGSGNTHGFLLRRE
jgi:hypothetical protein